MQELLNFHHHLRMVKIMVKKRAGLYFTNYAIILLVARKTKKQKIIAEKRKLGIKPSPVDIMPQQHLNEFKPTIDSISSATSKTNQSISIYSYPVHFIRKDLTKTFVLCILAISLEIALYFILEKNLVLPF